MNQQDYGKVKMKRIDRANMPEVHSSITDGEEIYTHELVDAMSSFFSEYLDSSMRLSISGESYRLALVSSVHLAYLLKLVGEYSLDNEVVDIKMTVKDEIIIETELRGGMPDVQMLSRLAEAGRNAGFSLELHGSYIIFRAKMGDTAAAILRALTRERILDTFRFVFFGN